MPRRTAGCPTVWWAGAGEHGTALTRTQPVQLNQAQGDNVDRDQAEHGAKEDEGGIARRIVAAMAAP
jgi:hypothetical protein